MYTTTGNRCKFSKIVTRDQMYIENQKRKVDIEQIFVAKSCSFLFLDLEYNP